MEEYFKIIKNVLENGELKENRTGVNTLAVVGSMFEHNMQDGFPLLTTKKIPFRLVSSELEFFIKGITDKNWLKENNNHIWDEWCSPDIVPYGNDEITKKKMLEERELGPIYGYQWRNFGKKYTAYNKEPEGSGVDQLKKVITTLKTNPTDRRMIVSSWNPLDLGHMALPPCHFCFQLIVTNNKLNLLWSQRSVDLALGLPFNISSYALLLHLLAKEANLKEGKLVGFLADVHIYTNHINGLKEQIQRKPKNLPKIETTDFVSIFDWKYTDTKVIDYDPEPTIKFEIAV